MSKVTTNYNLTKIDLSDSPPDITVINSNWDKIDELLKSHDTSISGFDTWVTQQIQAAILASWEASY